MAKYFWLKLDRNFFKRHDIQVIESMPNGKDYILFYLKLLVESIDHEGHLRFNETIPYDDNMLSVITNTNIDIVRSSISLFTKLNLMEKLDDATIYLKETQKMLGEGSSTERVRAFRERQKLPLISGNVTETLHETEIEKEIEIDLEKDKEIEKKKSNARTKHKHGEYNHVLLTDDEYQKLLEEYDNAEEIIKYLDEYIEMKGVSYKSHYMAIKKWVVQAVQERKQKPQKGERNGKERNEFGDIGTVL